MKYSVVIGYFLLGISAGMYAQVTIGSSEIVEQAAVLDLKSQVADAQNSTTGTGGILLPRVSLNDLRTLEPFIKVTDAEWIEEAKREALKQEHTGLEVYNLTENTTFAPGPYVWNGIQWEQLFKEIKPIVPIRIAFPLPAFNLPLMADGDSNTLTVDLYSIYSINLRSNHFITNMDDDDKLDVLINYRYPLTDLDFVVTHYDKSVLTINGISDSGIMSYTVHNINPSSSSFMNIYLVVKKGREKK
ncbi:hypothetical protein [Myroides sp. DW712]|uniref:hypothetical protein n=1 Tax=Myroides sp. DW712 TaxID=3389800 RepID=UPI00397C2688